MKLKTMTLLTTLISSFAAAPVFAAAPGQALENHFDRRLRGGVFNHETN